MKKPTVQNIMDVLNMPACERPLPAAVAPPSAPPADPLCYCGRLKSQHVRSTHPAMQAPEYLFCDNNRLETFKERPPETTAPTAPRCNSCCHSMVGSEHVPDWWKCVNASCSMYRTIVERAVSPVASSATPTPEPTLITQLAEAYRFTAERAAISEALGKLDQAQCNAEADAAEVAFMGALASSQQEVERYRAALKDIATNYDHDEQTRDHREGYGGFCRVCTAERALAIFDRSSR